MILEVYFIFSFMNKKFGIFKKRIGYYKGLNFLKFKIQFGVLRI